MNAYYNPQMNDINFPAGVLQPPLYDPEDGRCSELRQHRLDHRSRVDPRASTMKGASSMRKGNLKDWWTKEDAEAVRQAAPIAWSDQYAKYVVVDDIHIN